MQETMQEKIRKLIKNTGKTLQQISDEIGNKSDFPVSPATLSELQTKTDKGFDYRFIKAIAQYFGVSSDYLLGLSPYKTTDAKPKAVCEYTGLSEDAVRVLSKYRIIGDSDLIDFVSCLVTIADKTRIPITLDDLRACTTVLAGMYSFDGVNTLEKLETLWDDVNDLETGTNGMKYEINRFLGDVIDEYSVSNYGIDYAELIEWKENFDAEIKKRTATYLEKAEGSADEEH